MGDNRQFVIDFAGNIIWETVAEPGERLHWGSFKPDGDLVFLKTLEDEGMMELWSVTPVPGAELSLLLRQREPLGLKFVDVSADRIFMNLPEIESDIYVMDLEWE